MCTNDWSFFDGAALFHGAVPRVMGTRLEFVTAGTPLPEVTPFWNWLKEEAFRLDALLNRFDPESAVSRARETSRQGPVPAGPELAVLLREALAYRERTGGLFDVTLGRGGVRQEDGTLVLENADLDFGGFAKGYLLREAKGRLAAAGIRCAFVDFGASAILGVGTHPHGDSWLVDVNDPFHPGVVLARTALRDRALSTSGNMPGYTGHIVHPATGRAVEGRKVVTAVADDPLDAEVLTTALMAASFAEREELRGMFPDIQTEIFEIQ